jgi:hypothetical protein
MMYALSASPMSTSGDPWTSSHLGTQFSGPRWSALQPIPSVSWLTRHPEYNNTEHGKDPGAIGWRGHHFTTMCFDSRGRRCRQGSDFMRARDEGTFPVIWIWPDQIWELKLRPEFRFA